MDILHDIIRWCNCNEGAVSAVLSVCTIFISVIACWTSYKVGKLPYTKKIKMNTCCEGEDDGIRRKITVEVLNIGSCPIVLKKVIIKTKWGRKLGDSFFYNTNNDVFGAVFLRQGEVAREVVHINKVKYLDKHSENLNKKIKVIVKDDEGKRFIQKVDFSVG